MNGGVGVDEAEDLAGRRSRAAVSRSANATLGHVNDSRAAGSSDFGRAISRGVIGDEDFDLVAPARVIRARDLDRFQQPRQILLFVVSGDDDRESHRLKGTEKS